MKNVVAASLVLAFSAQALALTVVLKNEKIPANAGTLISMEMNVKSTLDLKAESALQYSALVSTTETSGKISITDNGQTQSQPMEDKKSVDQQVGTLKIGNGSITITDGTGKKATMKAEIKRANNKLTIKVSDKDLVSTAQAEFGEKIKQLAAENMVLQLSLTTSGMNCEGTNESLTCVTQASIKSVMGQ